MKVVHTMFKTIAGLIVGTAMAFVPTVTTHAAGAATLSLSPAGGTYTNGNTFSVGIYEDSGANDADSASASLTYDAGKLQATGISGGAFTTCVTQPSAGGGTISTGDCTILGAKRQGSQLLAVVTFKAIATGTAAVNFTSGKVVNAGTDLATTMSNGSFTINAPAQGGSGSGSGSGASAPTSTTTTTTAGQSAAARAATPTTTAATTSPVIENNDTSKPDVKGDSTKKNDTKKEIVQNTATKKHNVWPWVILVVVAAAAVAYVMRNRVSGAATAKKEAEADTSVKPVVNKPATTSKKKPSVQKTGKKNR